MRTRTETLRLWVLLSLAPLSAAQTLPSPDEAQRKLADSMRPIVEAVYAFRSTHGLWPLSLEELAPEYLDAVPSAAWYQWRPEGNCALSTTGAPPRAALVHVFGGIDAGWHVRVDRRYARLALPTPPVEPARLSNEMIERAAREYDRRIAREPDNALHHRCKVSLLLEAGACEPAAAAAVAWCRAFPADLNAREAAHAVECSRRSGLQAGQRLETAWMKAGHATLAEWSLYNNTYDYSISTDMMGAAVYKPFAVSDVDWFIADVTAMTIAGHYLYNDPKKALSTCRRWKSESERLAQPLHPGFALVRAAAFVRAGRFERAEQELAGYAPVEDEALKSLADEVRQRIAARSAEGDFRTRGLSPNTRWMLDSE